MTVAELIEYLQTLPKDTQIIKFVGETGREYRGVEFQYVQVLYKDGKIEKTLKVI